MNVIDRYRIVSYHKRRVGEGKYYSLGWRSEDSQIERYKVLANITDFNNKTILEPGCGYGDFLYLLSDSYDFLQYTGVELVPAFIQRVPKHFLSDPKIKFINGDFSKIKFSKYDVIIASGFLSYSVFDVKYYFNMISKMFYLADEMVGFNFLDQEKFGKHPLIKSHNKFEIVNYCKSLTENVKVIEGYLPDDVTIVLYK